MTAFRPSEIVRRLLPCLALIASVFALSPASGAPTAGTVEVLGIGTDTSSMIPPFIDAQDGIATRGAPWDPDPANWRKTAPIAIRGAEYGIDTATVRLRIEGKGDPVNQTVPIQGILITDNSGSMAWSDPSNIRCLGMSEFVRQMTAADEVGVVYFDSVDPARLATPLTSNLGSADTTSCVANGGTNFEAALSTGNREMFGWGGGVDKRKAGHLHVYVFLSDGCDSGYQFDDDVDAAANAGVRIYTIGLGQQVCDQPLMDMATKTSGKYYFVSDPKDLVQVYRDLISSMKNDLAGKPPKSGVPMMRFKFTNDIEVVPNSFRCDSAACTSPTPTSPGAIIPQNKGLSLEWNAPVKELRIKQYWQIQLDVRSYKLGPQTMVNDIAQSYVEYDRFDGSPGGSDTFEQLYVEVAPDIPGIGTPGIAEPPQPPPPPPHGGIPQLIPQPQQVPITYIQNLPVLHGVTQVQGIPLQYLLGSVMGMAVADRVKVKSRIRQGVKIAMSSM